MKKVMVSTLVCSALALTMAASGCKKEEKAQEPTAPPAAEQKAAAPAAPTAAGAVVSYTFENGSEGWVGTDKAINSGAAHAQKHTGNGALKVSGTSVDGRWNFVTSPGFPVEAGKKYRLTGWMLVEKWDNAKQPPQLKCGMNEGTKWLSNAFSKKYDLKKTNQWQEVGVTFDVPQGATTGFIALEKGTKEPVNATVYLDDVKIVAAK